MKNEIQLLKNNDKRDWSDLEWVEEFYNFLRGHIPEGMEVPSHHALTKEQAFTIIWYLQEHFPLIPDHIEKCDNCGGLYDSNNSGYYNEQGNNIGNFFCDSCEHLAPYDKAEP